MTQNYAVKYLNIFMIRSYYFILYINDGHVLILWVPSYIAISKSTHISATYVGIYK